MRYKVGLGLPRMKGSGGYKRPRLKTTCGDNGGKNRLGLPCGCKELFKRGKAIERGTKVDKGARCKYHGGMLAGPKTPEGWARAIKAGTEALSRYRAKRNAQARIESWA